MQREKKKELVETLGPHFHPNELEEKFGIRANSVRYYCKQYKIPTYAETQKQRYKQLEQQFNRLYQQEREQLLTKFIPANGD